MNQAELIKCELTLKGLSEEFKNRWMYVADPESQTIIHCVHHADPIYINGGWVNMHTKTYLECSGKIGIVPMEQAINIPLAPEKHYYTHAKQQKAFTLLFKGIPDDWHSFSLKEDAGSGRGFYVPHIERNDTGIYHVILR